MSIVTNIPTLDDYRSADRSGKSNMRTMAETAMRDITDAMMAANMRGDDVPADGWATYAEWRDALAAWKESSKRSVVETDYAELARVRVATLRRAADMIESGAVRPSDIPDGIELAFDSDDVAVDDVRAIKIASESVARGSYNAIRGDDGALAFIVDMLEIGRFYSATEIAHIIEKNVPAYAGRKCSVGAVTNALVAGDRDSIEFVPAAGTNGNGGIRTV